MSDWIELFNGRDFSGWTSKREHTWQVVGGVSLHPDEPKRFQLSSPASGYPGALLNSEASRTVDLHTVAEYGSCELYLEFCVPLGSNSGVYLMGNYEIQILDSYGTPDSELKYGSCGGIYGRWIEETKTSYDGHPPRTNASRAPGEWQSFEITFHAPRFDAAGQKIANARFERLLHNGILIHENAECTGPTRGSWTEKDTPLGPLRLQGDHGPVAYRNLRLRRLEQE